MFQIFHKAGVLPFENLDCMEKARPLDNEGYLYATFTCSLEPGGKIIKGNSFCCPGFQKQRLEKKYKA